MPKAVVNQVSQAIRNQTRFGYLVTPDGVTKRFTAEQVIGDIGTLLLKTVEYVLDKQGRIEVVFLSDTQFPDSAERGLRERLLPGTRDTKLRPWEGS